MAAPVSRLDRIRTDPAVCHGAPTIRGMRLRVQDVLELLASGMTYEEIRDYCAVLVPEMNLGQLAFVLRAKYLVDAESYARVRGLPISITELSGDLMDALDHLEA